MSNDSGFIFTEEDFSCKQFDLLQEYYLKMTDHGMFQESGNFKINKNASKLYL